MNIRAYGDAAVLIDCESLEEAQSWFVALEAHAEAVLGARSVLLRGDPAVLRRLVAHTSAAPPLTPAGVAGIDVPVTYDGPDLANIARLTGLTEQEVVEAHIATPWTVAFGGFAPGFFYLVGAGPQLRVPRHESPRTRVPQGAVGLAGEFSGIYPRESPGGWQLLGRTTLSLWDTHRDPPALLTSGMSVRFVQQ